MADLIEIKRRAMVAKTLRDSPEFQEIVAQIRSDAGDLFFDPNSDTIALAKAHERVRAIETFMSVIDTRISDQSTADKQKAQDRAND